MTKVKWRLKRKEIYMLPLFPKMTYQIIHPYSTVSVSILLRTMRQHYTFLRCEGETSGLLLKICYFEIIFHLQEGTKKCTVKSPCTPLPKLTSYVTTVQYQNQETGSGNKPYTSYPYLTCSIWTPVYVCSST